MIHVEGLHKRYGERVLFEEAVQIAVLYCHLERLPTELRRPRVPSLNRNHGFDAGNEPCCLDCL